jgi:metallo-beta-lactamase family protein
MPKSITVHFLGAAGTVTGSKFLIQALGRQIMIDCGLFQGLKELRLLNWDYPPIEASDIDAVILTHAHLDHCGYLPKLVKAGFKGRIHGTLPTLEVAEIILHDSARINEEDAERANRRGYTKHSPAKPLYDEKDVQLTVPHFKAEPLDTWLVIDDQIRFRFRYNGHIIGATFVELEIAGKRLVFSGDVGRNHDLLMRAPAKPDEADIVFIESTYGNRIHPADHTKQELADVINRTISRAGSVIIPSFAVERTQSLMYLLWQLSDEGKIPNVPVYMDSPMGKNVLDVFIKYPEWHKLKPELCDAVCARIHRVKTVQETQAIVEDYHPKIVIAGSGMATGGRVLAYLEKHLEDELSTVLMVGYQAAGTRGRSLVDGEKQIKLHGKLLNVKAEIANIQTMSGHADQGELIGWLSELKQKPEHVFIIHGEADAALALKSKLDAEMQVKSYIPRLFEIVEIPLEG